MENQLPEIMEFTGAGITEGDFKVSMSKLLLYLNELLGSNGQKLNLIPSGIISMWSGATNAIPSGWALCNGENGTPDLRDKFVVGAGGNYAVGAKGGTTSAAISGNTGETTLTVAQMPSHRHGVPRASTPESSGNYTDKAAVGKSGSGTFDTTDAGGGQSHSHSLSGSVSTLPPFYALAFIMKL